MQTHTLSTKMGPWSNLHIKISLRNLDLNKNVIKYIKKIKYWCFWIMLKYFCETFKSKDIAPPMIKYSYRRQKMIKFRLKHYFGNLLKISFLSYFITFSFESRFLGEILMCKLLPTLFLLLSLEEIEEYKKVWRSSRVSEVNLRTLAPRWCSVWDIPALSKKFDICKNLNKFDGYPLRSSTLAMRL